MAGASRGDGSHPIPAVISEGREGPSAPGFAYEDRAEQVGKRAISMFLSKLFGFACIEKLSIKYVHASVQN